MDFVLGKFKLDSVRRSDCRSKFRADYHEFLDRPPVERVQRLYSLDEVKRSARVRDIGRRVDLNTLNVEFGSADIPQSEIPTLEGLAEAMEKLLARNPAETFLIEGHTDAVGSDYDNLALSDRRAEAVAVALSGSFDIPPENLAARGYGKQAFDALSAEMHAALSGLLVGQSHFMRGSMANWCETSYANGNAGPAAALAGSDPMTTASIDAPLAGPRMRPARCRH